MNTLEATMNALRLVTPDLTKWVMQNKDNGEISLQSILDNIREEAIKKEQEVIESYKQTDEYKRATFYQFLKEKYKLIDILTKLNNKDNSISFLEWLFVMKAYRDAKEAVSFIAAGREEFNGLLQPIISICNVAASNCNAFTREQIKEQLTKEAPFMLPVLEMVPNGN